LVGVKIKMKWTARRKLVWSGVLSGVVAMLASGCVGPQTAGVVDLQGRSVDILAAKQQKATVLIFVSDDCPISNRYIPEILRLQAAYAARGVQFWMVHPDGAEKAAAIRKHDHDFNLTVPALRDPRHDLARLAKAEVTPSAAVFTPGGQLAYHGRIDDRVAEFGEERPYPVRRNLAEALDAILSGRSVTETETKAVGCIISSVSK
jgi:AhpC/TSA family